MSIELFEAEAGLRVFIQTSLKEIDKTCVIMNPVVFGNLDGSLNRLELVTLIIDQGGVITIVRWGARHPGIENSAEREQIDLGVVAEAKDDLGRHKERGSDQRFCDGFGVQHSGKSEIGDLDRSGVCTTGSDEQVLGLQVTMDGSVGVENVQASCELFCKAMHLYEGEAAIGLSRLKTLRVSPTEIHDEIDGVVGSKNRV